MELMVTADAVAGAYGGFLVSAYPMGGLAPSLNTNQVLSRRNFSAAFSRPCAVLDVANMNNVTIDLPYCGATSWSEFATNLWEIQLYCIAPPYLATTGAATSPTFKFYMRLKEGYMFMNPIAQSGKAPDFLNMAKVAAVAVGVPPPVVGAVGTLVGTVTGRTRTSDVSAPTKVIQRLGSNSTNVSGPEACESFSLLPNPGFGEDDPLAGNAPTDFSTICAKETEIENFVWSSTDAMDAYVKTIPVTPFYWPSPAGVYSPTNAGYLGLPFNKWRGTCVYRVRVFGSAFHRGTLQVQWVPRSYSPSSSDFTHLVKNVNIELSVAQEVVIVVGFAQPQDWARSRLVSVAGSSDSGDPGFNGFLRFRVGSPLRSAVATSVNVLVTFCARDMQFQWVNTMVSHRNGTTAQFRDIVLQAGTIGESSKTISEIVLVEPAPKFVIGREMADGVEDVKAMVQVPGMCFSWETSPTTLTTYIAGINEVPISNAAFNGWGFAMTSGTPDDPDDDFNAFFGFYSAMYGGYRGSFRWRIRQNTATSSNVFVRLSQFAVNQRTYVLDIPKSNAHSLYIQAAGPWAEFLIPHMVSSRFLPAAYQDTSIQFAFDDAQMWTLESSYSNSEPLWVMSCAGPDCSFLNFLGPPMLVATFS